MREFATYLKHLLQLVLAPGSGWDDVSAEGIEPERLARRLLYPLIGIATVTALAKAAYGRQPISDAAVEAIAVLLSYVATYALSATTIRLWMPEHVDGEPNERKLRIVCTLVLSLLALSTTLCNLLPLTLGLPYLLPLAITMVAWKADRYLAVKAEYSTQYAMMALFTLTLPPILLQNLITWVASN